MKSVPAYPQGEPAFISMLKRHDPFVPNWDSAWTCSPDQLDVKRGLFLDFQFPDPEKLLETAIFDLERFMKEAGVAGSEIKITVRQDAALALEEYRLTIDDGIMIEGGDTEGIRRAMYYLRDLIAGSPYLEKGTSLRKPWLKNRISRCFFGPIKRPPFNIDELMNDLDYYPEEYLSRLAHEGVNGLWLTIVFREICDTSIRKAHPDAARRLAKLRDTVARCRRYGIKIWVFCIEPIYWAVKSGNPVPPGCEELMGPGYSAEDAGFQINSFCPKSELAQKYLYECSNSLFTEVPNLGGMIFISLGERMTSCISRIDPFGDGSPACPDCKLELDEIFSRVLTPMKNGMLAANPNAGFISWLYLPYVPQLSDWIYQLPKKLSKDIAMAFNFESGITATQQGKVRAGGDYWLSQVGPADRFGRMAEAAKGHCEFGAKLQVACSHEVATIPYVPVPGLIYRKYKAMKKLGVSHVIQCWYFGNYPGLMNEAAGKLAYEDFSGGEEAFLNSLAKPLWGKDYATAVNAWKHFTDSYSNYPLDFQFQYYGPLHDGPVWPLYLKVSMQPLTRTWKPEIFPSGDAIGECMKNFELNELVEQTRIMADHWEKGMAEMDKISCDANKLEFTLAEALNIQIHSARNILRFYALRSALLSGNNDSAALLKSMTEIVRKEIEGSRRLAELCKQDARLGYHSEAEVYKYFPEKLEWRASQLEELLGTDFKEAEAILDRNGNIAEYLMQNRTDHAVAGKLYDTGKIRWSFDVDSDNMYFHLEFPGKEEYPEIAFLYFMDRYGIRKPPECIVLKKSDNIITEDGWKAEAVVPRTLINYESEFNFGVERVGYPTGAPEIHHYSKPGQYHFENDCRLNFTFFSAEKLIPVKI